MSVPYSSSEVEAAAKAKEAAALTSAIASSSSSSSARDSAVQETSAKTTNAPTRQVIATASGGNAAALGNASMSVSSSPGATMIAVVNSLTQNIYPASSSSISSTTTATTSSAKAVKSEDIEKALREFYGSKKTIDKESSIDGKAFPLLQVQLSIVDERNYKIDDTKDSKDNKYQEAWYKNKVTTPPEKLFELTAEESNQHQRPIKKIRVVGPAGIGKTTFTQYVSYQWATNGLWNDRFKCLFWLKLRNLIKYADDTVSAARDVIFAECFPIKTRNKTEVETIKTDIESILIRQQRERNQPECLLVLDGYDEIVGLLNSKPVVQRIFAELMACPYVVLTSRPYCLDRLHGFEFDRKLENCGFNSEQITKYIANYFPEQKGQKALSDWVQSQDMVMGLAQIPVTLNILCALYARNRLDLSNIKGEESILVYLYKEMLSYLITEHYFNPHEIDTTNLRSFSDIEKKYAAELEYLGRVAYKGLQNQGQAIIEPKIFDAVDKEFDSKTTTGTNNRIFEMGLLRPIDYSDVAGRYKPNEFLHFSLQEFLAARFLVEQLKSNKQNEADVAKKFFRTQKYNSVYHMVFNFAAGLVHESKTVETFWQELLTEPLDLTGVDHMRLMLRCLDAVSQLDKKIPCIETVIKEMRQWLRAKIDDQDNFILHLLIDYAFIPTLRDSSTLLCGCICDDILIKTLDSSLCMSSINMLKSLGAKAATTKILQWVHASLCDPDDRRILLATATISCLGGKAATKEILEWVNTKLESKESLSEDIKESVLNAINGLAAKPATINSKILKMINESLTPTNSPFIRQLALSAVWKLGEKAIILDNLEKISKVFEGEEEQNPRGKSIKETTIETIKELGAKIITPGKTQEILKWIIEALNTKDRQRILTALYMIQGMREKAATDEIVKLVDGKFGVEEKDVEIQNNVLATLGRLGGKALTSNFLDWMHTKLKAEIKSTSAQLERDDIKGLALAAINALGTKVTSPKILEWIRKSLLTKVIKTDIADLEKKTSISEYLEKVSKELENKNNIQNNINNLEIIKSLGAKAATPKFLRWIDEKLRAGQKHIVANALQALISIGEKAISPSRIKFILSRLMDIFHNNSSLRFITINDRGVNYLLSAPLPDLLRQCLSTPATVAPSLIVNLALLQGKAITVTDNTIQIYGDGEPENIFLPEDPTLKRHLITTLIQAFALTFHQYHLPNQTAIFVPMVSRSKLFWDEKCEAPLVANDPPFLCVPHCYLPDEAVRIRLNPNHQDYKTDRAAVLGKALAECKESVLYLDLSGNNLSDWSSDKKLERHDIFQISEELLKKHRNLHTLVLSRNEITFDGLTELMKVIISEKLPLRYLYLDHNLIAFDDVYCKELEKLLDQTNLQFLDLSMSFIFQGKMLAERYNNKEQRIMYSQSQHEQELGHMLSQQISDAKELEQKAHEQRIWCELFFQRSPVAKSNCISKSDYVRSIIAEDQKISNDAGTIALLANNVKITGFNEHAYLAIEQVHDYGQRSIIVAELFAEKDKSSTTTNKGQIKISVKYYTPIEFLKRTGNAYKITASVPKVLLRALVDKILTSQRLQNFYDYELFPGENEGVYNCFKWAAKMLEAIGIVKDYRTWIPSQECKVGSQCCVLM